MSTSASRSARSRNQSTAPIRSLKWRVVDIVVASVLGVASGLIFLIWNLAYLGPSTIITPLLPGLQGLLNGPWVFAGVLGALVIRKPGAAIYTEVLAAVVSALVGNQWGGFSTIEAGLVQGLGAELIFLIFFYKKWSLPVAVFAGVGAGAAGAINDLVIYYPGSDVLFSTVYFASSAISGAIVAGLLSWLLVRGLASTGALDRFAAGREVRGRV